MQASSRPSRSAERAAEHALQSARQRAQEAFVAKVIEAANRDSKTPEEAMDIAKRNVLDQDHWSCKRRLDQADQADQPTTIIEKLFRGSAVNHRAFFMKDSMYVNIKTAKESKILSLSLDSMKEII